ncbi:hypothetical protein C8N46_11357 [Kordia periserrulae]|uniref:Uncharacterized protein n=2 Tax=Kordia periserrulae TaxID=701523 RepID=A0A2T6BR92_9FLAO|nr:hypothetical protein C8N46_11357 [Kordia periserrulae]
MRGESDEIGQIEGTSHQEHNSKKTHIKKRQDYDFVLQQLLAHQEAMRRFEEILDQLAERLAELERLQKRSIDAQKLIAAKDTNGSIEFLIEHYGIERDDLDAMSPGEIMAVMLNLERQNCDSIETLKSDIKNLAHKAYLIAGEHFDTDNPQHQKLMNQLEAMEARAQKLDMDFDKILEHAHFETENTYTLLKAQMNENSESDVFQDSEKITDKFNIVVQNSSEFKQQHDNALDNENDKSNKVIGMNL